MVKIVSAILVQVLFFGIMGYIDTLQMLRPAFRETLVFGLRPYILGWLLCGPFAFWWSLHTLQSELQAFWTVNVIVAAVIFTAGISARWFASGINPGRGDVLALLLIFAAICCSRFIK